MKSSIKNSLLNVITFGRLKKKAKTLANQTNNEIKTAQKIPFKIEQFFELCGSINNIISVDNTISSLKIKFKDLSLVNLEKIKKLGCKGILKNDNQLTFLFGDYSKAICQSIKKAM